MRRKENHRYIVNGTHPSHLQGWFEPDISVSVLGGGRGKRGDEKYREKRTEIKIGK